MGYCTGLAVVPGLGEGELAAVTLAFLRGAALGLTLEDVLGSTLPTAQSTTVTVPGDLPDAGTDIAGGIPGAPTDVSAGDSGEPGGEGEPSGGTPGGGDGGVGDGGGGEGGGGGGGVGDGGGGGEGGGDGGVGDGGGGEGGGDGGEDGDACFDGSTLVWLANGKRKPISEIAIGDQVKIPDGGNGVTYATVKLITVKPVNEVVEIRLSDGDKLVTTSSHRLHLDSGTPIPVRELRRDAKLASAEMADVQALSGAVVLGRNIMYNLQLHGATNYIVGNSGIIANIFKEEEGI